MEREKGNTEPVRELQRVQESEHDLNGGGNRKRYIHRRINKTFAEKTRHSLKANRTLRLTRQICEIKIKLPR